MLLALENKRQHFEEDHCVTSKLIAAWGDYHVLVLCGISQTKKLSLSHYTRVYVTNTSASCFLFLCKHTTLEERKVRWSIDRNTPSSSFSSSHTWPMFGYRGAADPDLTLTFFTGDEWSITVLTARKILPLLDLLGKFKRVLACSCSPNFCVARKLAKHIFYFCSCSQKHRSARHARECSQRPLVTRGFLL